MHVEVFTAGSEGAARQQNTLGISRNNFFTLTFVILILQVHVKHGKDFQDKLDFSDF